MTLNLLIWGTYEIGLESFLSKMTFLSNFENLIVKWLDNERVGICWPFFNEGHSDHYIWSVNIIKGEGPTITILLLKKLGTILEIKTL